MELRGVEVSVGTESAGTPYVLPLSLAEPLAARLVVVLPASAQAHSATRGALHGLHFLNLAAAQSSPGCNHTCSQQRDHAWWWVRAPSWSTCPHISPWQFAAVDSVRAVLFDDEPLLIRIRKDTRHSHRITGLREGGARAAPFVFLGYTSVKYRERTRPSLVASWLVGWLPPAGHFSRGREERQLLSPPPSSPHAGVSSWTHSGQQPIFPPAL